MIVGGADGVRDIDLLVRQPLALEERAAAERTLSMLLQMVAEDFDRYVDVLMSDREDLMAFFSCAEPSLSTELAARVRDRTAAQRADYRVSTLLTMADADLEVFAAVHEEVERARVDGPGLEHDRLVQQAWEFLANYSARRRYYSDI